MASNKVIKNIRKRKKKPSSLYVNIDWGKVSKLFQNLPPTSSSQKTTFPQIGEMLKVLAAAGAIGLTFAFPGAAPAIGALVLGGQHYGRWRSKQILVRMAKQKLVKIKEESDGTVTVKITKNGMKRALTYQLDSMMIKKPKKWDKRWRVVIFDIPEKYKKVRDTFRVRLKQLGLYRLQDSVFVLPYPCFDEIEFLREIYGISFTVRYLLVDKIEDDVQLKEYFNLL